MVVLDEADRMFEMGFEYQMRSIVNNIRSQHFSLPLLSSLLTELGVVDLIDRCFCSVQQ